MHQRSRVSLVYVYDAFHPRVDGAVVVVSALYRECVGVGPAVCDGVGGKRVQAVRVQSGISPYRVIDAPVVSPEDCRAVYGGII